MKKLFLLFLIPAFAFTFANDWVTTRINDRVSIDFPKEPTEEDFSGNTVWIADPNEDARCMIMVVDFEKMGTDSAKLEAELATTQGYENFRDGIMESFPEGSIQSESKSRFKGYHKFNYVIDMGYKDASSFNILYSWNYFIGTKLYAVYFYEKDNKPMKEMREKFINSFKLTK